MKRIFLYIAVLTLSLSCSSKMDNSQFVPEGDVPGGGTVTDEGVIDPGHKEGDWMVYQVDEGVTWYNFETHDELSKARQIVNVIKVDLNSGKYNICFNWAEGAMATSSVFRGRKALATINGGFEPQSIYVKTSGQTRASIVSDVIPGTDVPQWKNEGAIFTDGNQSVQVEYCCKDLNLSQTREWYANDTRSNVISSAPMLIDDFDPIGKTYIQRLGYVEGMDLTTMDYENPIRHQGVRHPRTAVALTKDNEFLMITVDGRWPGKSEGMSAKELTEFIVKHFNPQYALNLDGGGSTTMCVKGYGDKTTHVVNYPTENGVFDHTGERSVTSHIYVIKN